MPNNHTKESIKDKLQTNDQWLYRGLVAIFNKQTQDEKATEETRHHNNIGFTGADAKRMTYYAKWVIRNGRLTKQYHINICRKRMLKYAGQLAKIANHKI